MKASRPARFSVSQRKARGFYTIRQLAELFQMTEACFYRLLKDGEGPYRRLNQFISARNEVDPEI